MSKKVKMEQKQGIDALIRGGLRVKKRFDDSLVIITVDDKSKSVSIPSAQSARPCVYGYDWEAVNRELVEKVGSCRYVSKSYYCLFLIMYYSGCRVSEVLRLREKDILDNDYVIITASKGSENRAVHVPNIGSMCISNDFNSDDLLFNMDRFAVYRMSRKIGFDNIDCGLFSDKPTKLFRYALASSVYSKTKDIDIVARLLGHKNSDNSRFYIFELSGSRKK